MSFTFLRRPSRSHMRHLHQLNDVERRKKDAIAAAQSQLLAAEPGRITTISGQTYEVQTSAIMEELQSAAAEMRNRRLGNLSTLLPGIFRLHDKPFTLDRHFVFEPLFETRMPSSITVKAGRQVGKCVRRSSAPTVWCADGRLIGTATVRIGDELLSYDEHFRPVRGRVVNIFDSGTKRCYRVTTRLGAEL